MPNHDGKQLTKDTVKNSLVRLREIIDERERLARQDRELSAEKAAIEQALMDLSELLGTDIFRSKALTVTIKDATRYNVDPSRWDDLYAWAVQSGNTQVLHHRSSDSAFDELVNIGKGIPDFVSMENYKKLSAQRKSR